MRNEQGGDLLIRVEGHRELQQEWRQFRLGPEVRDRKQFHHHRLDDREHRQ
jgi:hypothetical protein